MRSLSKKLIRRKEYALGEAIHTVVEQRWEEIQIDSEAWLDEIFDIEEP
jgi:hypothetical protein